MATDYTLQIGFKWNAAVGKNGKRSLCFAFLKGNSVYGKTYPPTSPLQKDSSKDYVYTFQKKDTLKWEVFDLTGDSTKRYLSFLKAPFTLKGANPTAATPFQQKSFTSIDPQGVASGSTQKCDHLPGATKDTSYPLWTPPSGSFTFDTGFATMRDYTFTVEIHILDKVGGEPKVFYVDPEMMVGSGGGH